MKEKVILPLVDDVPFTAYQQRGYELGSLLTVGDKVKPWLHQFFINIFMSRKNEGYGPFDFVYEKKKWFEGYDVFFSSTLNINHRSAFSNYFDFIQLIKDNIKNSSYVRGDFDEYYIPCKSSYMKRHFIHTFFLYGYDETQKIFYALGYTKSGKFERYQISYSDFMEAFLARESFWVSFKKINPDFVYSFNPISVRKELYEYINSVYTGKGAVTNEVYGVSCFDAFNEYIINARKMSTPVDLRYSRFFLEYKKYMAELIAYLVDNNYISDSYNDFCVEMVGALERVHLLFLKYNMTAKPETADSIIEIIARVAFKEKQTMRQIYKELDESVEAMIAQGSLFTKIGRDF